MSAATGDRWVLSPPIELRRMWESTGFLNRRILQIYEAIFTAEAAQFDLTVRQFGALLAILAHPGLSQAAVGQIIGVSRTNTAMVVGNLVRKGLVSEEVDPADRRRKRYVITPDGTARAWDSIPAMARTEARLLAPLDADERRELERALGHMVLANNGLLSVPLFGLMEAISDPRWPVPSDALRQGVGAPFLVND
jgi:DNA-binding MarR family transcriptional regulator